MNAVEIGLLWTETRERGVYLDGAAAAMTRTARRPVATKERDASRQLLERQEVEHVVEKSPSSSKDWCGCKDARGIPRLIFGICLSEQALAGHRHDQLA